MMPKTPQNNPLSPEQLMIERAIRELVSASGFGVVSLTFKNGTLEEIEVCYTRKAKMERSVQQGSD